VLRARALHGRRQIAAARRYPEINVIVHPGVPPRVVAAADVDGSTELILDTIASAPPAASGRSATEITWGTGWPPRIPTS